MTIREALGWAEDKQRILTQYRYRFTALDIEQNGICIEALEKQIPKKPIYQGDGYYDGELVYDTWFCPNCDAGYEVGTDEYNYCPNCGQAIDWSEESE